MPGSTTREYQDFLKRLSAKTDPTSTKRPTAWFRETILTLILGSLSASLGLVAMAAAVAGIMNRPLDDWNDSLYGALGIYRTLSVLATIVGFLGLTIGVVGVLASQKKSSLSLVSLVGVGLSYLSFLIALVHAISHDFR
jgi:hypothetical protein